jgi:hypothetical protein
LLSIPIQLWPTGGRLLPAAQSNETCTLEMPTMASAGYVGQWQLGKWLVHTNTAWP